MSKSTKKKVHRPFCLPRITVILGLVVSGCTSVQLEFDRMTGTAYPPAQTVGGNTVDLGSIYIDAGKLLVIDEDDTNIAPLTVSGSQKQCITNAETDSLMAANRNSVTGKTTRVCSSFVCTDYHLYGIVVDHFGSNSSTNACSFGLLGRMWRTADRSGFAMFYSNSDVSGDGAKFLRSAAHEIGHAYNLHHEDGDGSSTIMNQTSVVGSSFSYTFSTTSETHLDDHPDGCKYPGVGVFGEVDSAHPDHDWTTVVGC